MAPAVRHWRAFSLVELVVVLAILGVVAAVAVPRFGAATTSATDHSVEASRALLQEAVDRFAIEHTGSKSWRQNQSGVPNSVHIAKAMLEATHRNGDVGGDVGPYLRALPANLKLGASYVGIAVKNGTDIECEEADDDDGLGQAWNASRCGWILDLADLSVTAHP